MSDNAPPLPFSYDPQLPPGAVAVVFYKDGNAALQHNVAEVVEKRRIEGGPEGAGFVMALAALLMAGDEEVFTGYMRKAAAALYGIGSTPTTGALN